MSLKSKSLWLVLVLSSTASGTCAALVLWELTHRGSPALEPVGLRELALVSGLVAVSLVAAIAAISLSALHLVVWKPIHEIVAMALAVGAGNFDKRLGFKRRDAIGRLAFEMDTLADQLEAARHASDAHIEALEQLRHSDRVATLGRLASSVAHELGNPLNVIELRAQFIVTGDAATLPEACQNAAIIVTQARRMTRIIGEILSFARRQPASVASLDLMVVVRNAIALSEHTAKKRALSIQLEDAAPSLELPGDADKLLQIVVNLVMNGVQATDAGGVVTVGVRNVAQPAQHDPDGPDEAYACIDVIDRGTGIPQESLSRIFDPFFSSKQAGEGTGLGLSIAQGIAKEHGGWIEVDSELGRGSHFSVYLPRNGRKDGNGHDWQASLRR